MKKAKKPLPKTTCHAKLNKEQVQWIEKMGKETGMSKSWVMRRVISYAQQAEKTEWCFIQNP